MRSTPFTSTLFAAALLGAALPAGAQGFIELGGFGSAAKFDPSLPFGTLSAGGARLTLASGSGLKTFMLEGDASYYRYPLGGALGNVQMLPVHVRYAYAPSFGPYSIILGAGGVRNQYTNKSAIRPNMRDVGYSGLVGLRLAVGSYLSLRVDGVVDYITHPITGTAQRNTNRSLQAGMSFPLWIGHAKEKPAPAPAPVVAAPVVAAPVAPAVDSDGDGIPDSRDQCAHTPPGSSVDGAGCPVYYDSDNDGVIDQKDLCQTTPPNTPVDGHGCALASDSDNDGVPDVRDRCPATPAGTPVNSVGCAIPVAPVAEPDGDKDGVPDSRDKCLDSPAGSSVDSVGCPVALFKNNERTVTLRGVNFEPAKDDLLPSSMAILDDVAKQLLESPSVKVEVGGHTDSHGKYTSNVRLSVARAEAVRAYLIMRGVGADRLVARGYGPDKPVSGNGSASGRAMNRRVELTRVD
jgi:outer membrane protein OmpA-like peptidoglycan-associated protein